MAKMNQQCFLLSSATTPPYKNKTTFKPIWVLRVMMILLMAISGWSCKRTVYAVDTTGNGMSVYLSQGWKIQSAEVCQEKGEVISTPSFKPDKWYDATVPSTVLAALVKNGVYKEIYFSKNMEKIPTTQFLKSWWYRTEFTPGDLSTFPFARLIFEGINFRANIFLNGEKIATPDIIKGSFRIFSINVQDQIKKGKNVLAVEVFPPQKGDLTIGFVDWNPTPPDHNMGLWRGVQLRLSGPVSIEYPTVRSQIDKEILNSAQLTVSANLINHSSKELLGVLRGEIEETSFQQPFSLRPYEKKTITFYPREFKELVKQNPRLWWPNNMGEAHLYRLKMTALLEEERLSDEIITNFGVREVEDYINEQGHRGYKINGQKILIRGGGWVDDLMLADEPEKVEAQFQYVKHMNLNTVRLEGFWGNSQILYNMADKYGILLMAGWSCQWEWQEYVGKEVDDFGAVKTDEEMDLVIQSMADQVIYLRHHPSILVWVLGSDRLPRPVLEKRYDALFPVVDPTRPVLKSCKWLVSEISGPSAVKMNGPYDYVPPVYWYVDEKNGGAFGFNTETGPGPQPPPLESLRRMLPEKQLWPINDYWDYHCGRNEFNTLNRYMTAFNKRYGEANGVAEFAFKAQAANYEAMRAMFEAFGANKPKTTGVIQWMLNSAWPEMYWQLYDYFLMPNGAFYGAKIGCQPLNILYHYGQNAIYTVNDTLTEQSALTAEITLLDLQGKIRYQNKIATSMSANAAQKILDLPIINDLSPVYFLDLKLGDSKGNLKGTNFYWLSKRLDQLDEKNGTWFYTPQSEYADFTALNDLPKVALQVEHHFDMVGHEQTVTVTLKNPGLHVAFFIQLEVVGEQSGRSILPIFWEDNYISLLPGESKTIHGSFSTKDKGGEKPIFRLSGWNLE